MSDARYHPGGCPLPLKLIPTSRANNPKKSYSIAVTLIHGDLRLVGGLLLAVVAVAACQGGNDTPSGPSPPSGVPTVNSAPTVTLASQGAASCNPVGIQSGCTVTLKALASDPDGDPLTYTWSGTTSGFTSTGHCQSSPSSPDTGICRILSPEQVVVGSVVVRDDHGHA